MKQETKIKISKSLIGRKKSNEIKEKMSESHKGKTHTDDTKLKIKKSMQRRYVIYFIKNDEIINVFNLQSFQLKQFCYVYKISYSGLMRAKKNNKIYKKYWYITEKINKI